MTGSVLITGANRGLGQSLVNKFAAEGWQVFAGQRELASSGVSARELSKHVTLLGLDVQDTSSVASALRAVEERSAGLDVLINNAAVNPRGDDAAIGELDFDAIALAYDVTRSARSGSFKVFSQSSSVERASSSSTYRRRRVVCSTPGGSAAMGTA